MSNINTLNLKHLMEKPINCLGWTGERINLKKGKVILETYEPKWKRYKTVTSFPIRVMREYITDDMIIRKIKSDQLEFLIFFDYRKHILTGQAEGMVVVKLLAIDKYVSYSEIIKIS